MHTVQEFLHNSTTSAVAILLAASVLVWVTGRAIRVARSSPADENLMAFLRDQSEQMQRLAHDALLTTRSSGKSVTTRRGTRASEEPIVLPGQDEDTLVSRLRDVLGEDPSKWGASERGFVLNFGTPERLAIVFATEPERADALLRYASTWWRGQGALRTELRKRLAQASQHDPIAAIVATAAAEVDTPTGVNNAVPILVGAVAGSGSVG